MNADDLLNEVAIILAGEHPSFAGISDRVGDAEIYMLTFAREFPEDAKQVAQDIRSDKKRASELCDLPPERCGWIASFLDRALWQAHVREAVAT